MKSPEPSFKLMRGERIQIPLLSGPSSAASETPFMFYMAFPWRADGDLTLNAGLVASWFGDLDQYW